MFAIKIGVINGLLAVPEIALFVAYQTISPEIQVADNEALVPKQMFLFVVIGVTGIDVTATALPTLWLKPQSFLQIA